MRILLCLTLIHCGVAQGVAVSSPEESALSSGAIFTDSFAPGWSGSGWSGTAVAESGKIKGTFNGTSAKADCAHADEVLGSGVGVLYDWNLPVVAASDFASFVFQIKPAAATTVTPAQICVAINNGSAYVPLSNYISSWSPDAFSTSIRIPMSAINSANGSFHRIAFRNNSGDPNLSFYLDNVSLSNLTAPLVSTFTSSAANVAAGAPVTLSWTLSGGAPTTLAITPNVGSVLGTTSKVVTVAATTTYRLTATNAAGTSFKDVTINVVAKPVISAFSASPSSIVSGASSQLSWTVSAATSLSLSSIGAVSGTSVSVSPATTTTYTLSATNAGGTTTATQTVTVSQSSGGTENVFVDAFSTAWGYSGSWAPVSIVAVAGMGNVIKVTSAPQWTALSLGRTTPITPSEYVAINFTAQGSGSIRLSAGNGSNEVIVPLTSTWTAFRILVAALDSKGTNFSDVYFKATVANQTFSVDNVEMETLAAGAFAISVPLQLDKGSVDPGATLSATVTYRNGTNSAVSLQQIGITARPPGGTNAGGPYIAFEPVLGAQTVQPGATLTVTASRGFSAADAAGGWYTYSTYQDSNGIWHDGPSVTFTVNAPPPPTSGRYTTGVAFRGINRAGLEYGDDWDGWTGQTYFDQPNASEIAAELSYLSAAGFNIIRLPISWERAQHTLNGPLTASYVSSVMAYINAATGAGFHVILDLHNYNRYAQGAYNSAGVQVGGYTQRVLGDGVLTVAHLSDVWVKLTGLVLANPKVILNLMNESHDFPMTSTAWFSAIQTVMNAIRATGSTQLILVPNSRSSDVSHWSSYSPNGGPLDSVAALAITDSANNYAYDMHAYQDYPTSSSSYASLLANVTAWARANGKKLFLSEMGSASNAANGAAGVGGALDYMNTNNDVWLGWTPWDLPPYSVTAGATADGPEALWYRSHLTANFLNP